MRWKTMKRELALYAVWYNEYRPHTYIQGRTPQEVYDGIPPSNEQPRLEPRSRYPRGSPCASPQADVDGEPGSKLVLTVGYLENRKHLPVCRR